MLLKRNAIKKKSRQIKQRDTLISTNETNKIVVIMLGLLVALLFSLLFNLILLGTNNSLANKRTVFVQQPNGVTVKAEEKDENFRDDAVIRSTISNWLPLMFEWDNRIANSESVDLGLQIDAQGARFKIPTKVYMASFLLDPNLRFEYLKTISKEIPEGVYKGDIRSVLEVRHIGKPIRKGNDYEVNVMAIRTDISTSARGQLSRESKFYKTLTTSPVEPYRNVLGKNEPSAFRFQLAELLKNGVTISAIKDLKAGA